jgi:UDP-N-acetyl-D-galactosamine dehydrogenase
MGEHVATQIRKTMIRKDIRINGAEILMLGITFKENCTDGRNTKIVDIISASKYYNVNIIIYVLWANPAEVMHEYGLSCHSALEPCHPELVSASFTDKAKHHVAVESSNAIVLGVADSTFPDLDIQALKKENARVYDFKGILKYKADNRL